tara:strand:+ start:1531 stop:1677 length:147 start_codon:yes stop_codon:yes gene_type:complete
MKEWIEEKIKILKSNNVIPFPFSAERVERLRKAQEDERQTKELPKDTS